MATTKDDDTSVVPLTGRDLRIMRGVRGLSQTELARRIDVSTSKLQAIEAGKEKLSPAIEIRAAHALWPPR